MKTFRILLVDDEEATLFGYNRYLTLIGYSIETAKYLKDAKTLIIKEHFDAIIIDLRLPDGNAIDWIAELHTAHENLAIIVVTGVSDIPTAVKAVKYGAYNFLTKPVNMDDLAVSLKKGLEVEELRKRDSMYQRLAPQKVEPFFGSSTIIKNVIQYADVAAMNNNVVLIQGETGTGKGVLARWIHDHSSRKNDPFVEVNCSSLKGEMFRSDLFGHVKGAFATATKNRAGLIEYVDGGTLFLDQIGDMDIEAQGQLLTTIEDKSYRRIGENRLRTSDFRLICSTNRNLSEELYKKTLRKDLFYRISAFPINLPALRDRKEDLPGLIKHLLFSFSYDPNHLSEEVISLLCSYSWPGNIREMRNTLERALLLANGGPLSTYHFPGISRIKVFLSHNFLDKPFAKRLSDSLSQEGISTWLDITEMQVGDSLISKISEGISECSYLAVILSPNSVSSQWVQREVNIALTQEIAGKRVKVLPLLYKECEIPEFLIDKLFADFTHNFQSGLEQLLSRLKNDLQLDENCWKY